jgi:hypothetical protein
METQFFFSFSEPGASEGLHPATQVGRRKHRWTWWSLGRSFTDWKNQSWLFTSSASKCIIITALPSLRGDQLLLDMPVHSRCFFFLSLSISSGFSTLLASMVPVQIKPNHIMPMDSTNFYLLGDEVATWDHCVYYILEIALIMLCRARKLTPFGCHM